jgi:hypothetical protein
MVAFFIETMSVILHENFTSSTFLVDNVSNN